jgi:hypothetical protein
MVDYVLPRGGTRGTTVEVEFHGKWLSDPRQVLFYEPGIAASEFIPFAHPDDGFKVKFQIAPDCPLGEHVFRVRTATSLTDAATFWVSRFPTVFETEKNIGDNDSPEKAQPIPMNTTVEGSIFPSPAADKDFYRVEAVKGQRISVEVEAARLGTLHTYGENDLEVTILDSAGKQIAHNDDNPLFVQDPFVSIVAPYSGSYYVEIGQSIYYKPNQAWYRAHIGDFYRPTAIFPAGGQAGSAIDARIVGDPAGDRTERILLPSQAGNFPWFAGDRGHTPPSPNMLRVSPYPNVLRKPGEAVAAIPSLPAALNGIFEAPAQSDEYRFRAHKGEAWKIQVYARTLGNPVDPRIWVRAADSTKHLLDADDSTVADLGEVFAEWRLKEQLDPVAVFRVPADGDYVIGLEDNSGTYGPDHVYRAEIEAAKDTVYTSSTGHTHEFARLTGMVAPRGSRRTVNIQLAPGPGNSYKGDIELDAVGLPRGVTMIAPKFRSGVNKLPVQFIAAADAEEKAVLVDLRARAVDPAVHLETGSRLGFVSMTSTGGELPWHYFFVDKYAFAVTDTPPFDIELEEPHIALPQAGEFSLAVKAIRHNGFAGPIRLQMDWLPPGISGQTDSTIAAGENEGHFRLHADAKAAPGDYSIAMSASTTGGDDLGGNGEVRVSSKFANLRVVSPFLTIELPPSSIERGKETNLVGSVRRTGAFSGKARVSLTHLPRGITLLSPPPEIGLNDNQVTFRIAASPDALPGMYRGLSCDLILSVGTDSVSEETGSGILRVDNAKAVHQ